MDKELLQKLKIAGDKAENELWALLMSRPDICQRIKMLSITGLILPEDYNLIMMCLNIVGGDIYRREYEIMELENGADN